MYQAGIKNITLYENKGITFTFFDSGNDSAITALVNLGDKILIENIQQPEFDIKLKFSKSGVVTQDFKLKFFLLGLTLENYDLLTKLSNSIYGWCFLVEFYDGSFKFYNTPVYCRASDIKPHNEMAFAVTIESVVPTTQNYFEYAPIVFLPYYRFDSTVLSFDNEVYSFDYEL